LCVLNGIIKTINALRTVLCLFAAIVRLGARVQQGAAPRLRGPVVPLFQRAPDVRQHVSERRFCIRSGPAVAATAGHWRGAGLCPP